MRGVNDTGKVVAEQSRLPAVVEVGQGPRQHGGIDEGRAGPRSRVSQHANLGAGDGDTRHLLERRCNRFVAGGQHHRGQPLENFQLQPERAVAGVGDLGLDFAEF